MYIQNSTQYFVGEKETIAFTVYMEAESVVYKDILRLDQPELPEYILKFNKVSLWRHVLYTVKTNIIYAYVILSFGIFPAFFFKKIRK